MPPMSTQTKVAHLGFITEWFKTGKVTALQRHEEELKLFKAPCRSTTKNQTIDNTKHERKQGPTNIRVMWLNFNL